MKRTLLAVVAAGAIALGGFIITQAQGGSGVGCAHGHAFGLREFTDKLDLTADQQTKMDALMAEHHKAGCSEASEAAYMKQAEAILTKDQFAKFKAECKGHKDKAKTET